MHLQTFCKKLTNASKWRFRSAKLRTKQRILSLQQWLNGGVYAVNINASIGFFAQLTWCVYILEHCELNHLKPAIQLTGPLYARINEENWFEHYFIMTDWYDNPKNTAWDMLKFSCISHIHELGIPNYSLSMSVEHAHGLFTRHLTVKQEYSDHVNCFHNKNMANKKVLGVHYRGTDKIAEAERVNWDYASATIMKYLAINQDTDAIFIASDEEDFIRWIRQKIKQIEVISHDDKLRSMDGLAIHSRSSLGDNHLKGKEALINALLLSKCQTLIRTSSFLSAWSSIFNPTLPIIMLNRPYENTLRFPDSQLVKQSLTDYLP